MITVTKTDHSVDCPITDQKKKKKKKKKKIKKGPKNFKKKGGKILKVSRLFLNLCLNLKNLDLNLKI